MSFIGNHFEEQLTHEGVIKVNTPHTEPTKEETKAVEVTTETAVNLSGVLELIKARDELDTLSQSLTTESGFTFVTKVKDFFANTIREIRNKLSNIFSQQDITLKYQEDKIKELKLLTNICSRLGSIKFSQIEYIELPIMMGMKPNYNQTVFELNNLIASFKGATEQIEDLNNLLSNLIVDKDDINRCVSNAIIILSSVDFNNEILTNIVGDNVLQFNEEEFDIFKTKKQTSDFLDVESNNVYNDTDDTKQEDPDLID